MNARKHRIIESRRLSLVERTQRFINNHPEFIPEPLSYETIGFLKCASEACSHIRPIEEMINGYCSVSCFSKEAN